MRLVADRFRPLLLAMLGGMLCGCVGHEAVASDGKSEPTELDAHLSTLIEDVQTLSFAMRFIDPATENGQSLKEILGDMLGLKLLSLSQFLPTTGNDRVVSLACRVLEQATGDIYVVTDSCAERELCDRSYEVAQYCVAKGHATVDDIAIPKLD